MVKVQQMRLTVISTDTSRSKWLRSLWENSYTILKLNSVPYRGSTEGEIYHHLNCVIVYG